MLWLKKLNFMEIAKMEMELMRSFEADEDLETKLRDQELLATQTKDAEEVWKLEVWRKMLTRIRKMEGMLNRSSDPKL
ncbi:hypothetical protein CREGCYN_13990 [Synechococcus sp. M16CYN]